MRTIEEIMSDLKDCYSCENKNCLFPMPNNCGKPSDASVITYEAELLQAIKRVIALDRLTEICNAEQEGRLVVLPCKAGDEVWVIIKDYTECSVYGDKYSSSGCSGCEVECDSQPTKSIKRIRNVGLISIAGWLSSNCFGKTVFLTREAAEAALKERERQ